MPSTRRIKSHWQKGYNSSFREPTAWSSDRGVKSQIAQVELVQANLEAAIKLLNTRKEYIEILKNNYQLILQIDFKVGDRDYLIYTFGDDGSREK